jgi:hypothetical protein
MAKLYKLTTQDGWTRKKYFNALQWGDNVTHTAKGSGGLCTDGVIHAYLTPELAVLLNPVHAGIAEPLLWECEGEVVASDGQLKVGCKSLTTIRQVPLPEITLNQKAAFGILCVLNVYREPNFVAWAEDWLSGINRSKRAATKAAMAAATVTRARAAWATIWAEDTARAEDTAWAVAMAAEAMAAEAAIISGIELDLIALSIKCLEYK